MKHHHNILIVTFPGQGHINPSLQFAKGLLQFSNIEAVTFSTSSSAIRRLTNTNQPTPKGLTFAPFSDGHDNGLSGSVTMKQFFSDFTATGAPALEKLITTAGAEGHPFTHLIYTTLLPWAAQVAHCLNLPSTLFWSQPALILDIYHYYFNGYGDLIDSSCHNPSSSINLPGLPLLNISDLPSFFLPSCPNGYSFALPLFKEHLELLEVDQEQEQTTPSILVNTFDALEVDALKALKKFKLIAVGPLIPLPFSPSDQDQSEKTLRGDLISEKSRDYLEWLDTKLKSSVVYVSFGSLSTLTIEQAEEMAKGLLKSNRPFLWVIRDGENGERQEEKLSCREELLKSELGKIVPWCSQVEVLSHSSVGCFVTHCGWNSTLECLVSGVPAVAFPQWSDQATNAKLIEDVWGIGVRVRRNGDGIVEGGEIERCLDLVMGEGTGVARENAKKWRDLATEAVGIGGSSSLNLKDFVDGI